MLAGAEVGTDSESQGALSNYQRECQQGAKQEAAIEHWAKAVGLWTSNVEERLTLTLGEQIAEGGEAKVYDHGSTLVKSPDIYLSDMHDENVILSAAENIFVVDCDIRINTPELRQGGRRTLTTEVRFL